jgi:hypothetical protein
MVHIAFPYLYFNRRQLPEQACALCDESGHIQTADLYHFLLIKPYHSVAIVELVG